MKITIWTIQPPMSGPKVAPSEPPRLFPKNTILHSSRTCELDYLPAFVAPRDYTGGYTPLALQTLTVFNSIKR